MKAKTDFTLAYLLLAIWFPSTYKWWDNMGLESALRKQAERVNKFRLTHKHIPSAL